MNVSILKLSEENIRLYLYNLKEEINVLQKMPKSQTIKEKADTCNYTVECAHQNPHKVNKQTHPT